jgi:zinc protease
MAFETLGAKIGILRDVADYGFANDYVLQRENIVRNMTAERIGELASRFLDPHGMVWLIVGDAATQRDRLNALGLGDPIPIDRDGQPVR